MKDQYLEQMTDSLVSHIFGCGGLSLKEPIEKFVTQIYQYGFNKGKNTPQEPIPSKDEVQAVTVTKAWRIVLDGVRHIVWQNSDGTGNACVEHPIDRVFQRHWGICPPWATVQGQFFNDRMGMLEMCSLQDIPLEPSERVQIVEAWLGYANGADAAIFWRNNNETGNFFKVNSSQKCYKFNAPWSVVKRDLDACDPVVPFTLEGARKLIQG